MGKGNRTRNDRASQTLATAAPRTAAKQKRPMPTWVGTLIVVAVLVLLIAVVALSVLNSRGTFLRMRTIAKSENYKVTVPMMSYMVYSEYQNRVALYEQYSEQYGTTISIGGGTGGDALDTSTALRDQLYGELTLVDGTVVTDATWFDYFANTAESDVRQILACCEAARLYALDEDDYAAIEAELETIESYAANYGYTTNGYVGLMYGKGVILKDVRAMMELTQLATKWSEFKAEEFYNAVTDGRIDEYYNANKDTYDVYCDYRGYTFTATFTPSENEDEATAKTENEKALALYEAEQKRFVAYVEELITATDGEDFRGKLYQCLYTEELIKAADEKDYDLSKLADLSRDEINAKLIAEVEGLDVTACTKNAETAALEAVFTNIADGDVDNSTLEDWLFETKTEGEGDDAKKTFVRVKNETKKVESVNSATEEASSEGDADAQTETEVTYKEATSTYIAAIFTSDSMHRNTELYRNVGHILFDEDTFEGLKSTDALSGKIKELADKVLARDGIITAYTMACQLLDDLWKEGKITEVTRDDSSKYYTIDAAVFEEYGEIFTADSSVLYDDVYPGQMVDEFEDWLFDSARMKNEISYPEPVETEYGSHIMFYDGVETEAWKSDIHNTLSDEDNTAYLKDIQTTHTAEVNSNYWRYIQG